MKNLKNDFFGQTEDNGKQHGIKRLSINSTQNRVRQIYAENKQKPQKADKRSNLISREANSMKCGDKKLVPFLLWLYKPIVFY